MSQREIDAMMDEHIRRMGEPEPYRSLRLQKERIEHEQEHQARGAAYDRQAEQLRRDIRKLGARPCA
jgi:hypothetical protein